MRKVLGILAKKSASRQRPGFVFLVSVLVIGAIVTEMTMSLVLLGIAAQQSGFTITQTGQSLENALTCAERGLLNLRDDLSYDGGELVTLTNGTCAIAHTGGSGNENRSLCIEGVSGNTTRRIEIIIQQVYPRLKIGSWREVGAFTFCP